MKNNFKEVALRSLVNEFMSYNSYNYTEYKSYRYEEYKGSVISDSTTYTKELIDFLEECKEVGFTSKEACDYIIEHYLQPKKEAVEEDV